MNYIHTATSGDSVFLENQAELFSEKAYKFIALFIRVSYKLQQTQ